MEADLRGPRGCNLAGRKPLIIHSGPAFRGVIFATSVVVLALLAWCDLRGPGTLAAELSGWHRRFPKGTPREVVDRELLRLGSGGKIHTIVPGSDGRPKLYWITLRGRRSTLHQIGEALGLCSPPATAADLHIRINAQSQVESTADTTWLPGGGIPAQTTTRR